jgi:hypothetical protein
LFEEISKNQISKKCSSRRVTPGDVFKSSKFQRLKTAKKNISKFSQLWRPVTFLFEEISKNRRGQKCSPRWVTPGDVFTSSKFQHLRIAENAISRFFVSRLSEKSSSIPCHNTRQKFRIVIKISIFRHFPNTLEAHNSFVWRDIEK